MSSKLELKYKEYLKHYKISEKCKWLEKELDYDNDYNRDLREIAETITNWEVNLVVPLQIKDGEIKDIKDNTSKVELRRVELLKLWKKKMSFNATYGLLLQCCIKGEDTATAQSICKMLAGKVAEDVDGGASQPSPYQLYSNTGENASSVSTQPPSTGPEEVGLALDSGKQPSAAAIPPARPILQSQDPQQSVALFDYFEKGTVDSDGGSKVMQDEAAPRGQHIPQLKLDDDDRVSTIRAKPVRVTHQDLGYYPMNNVLHGIALIINNQHFTDLNHRERVGTARDEYNLKQTFLYLGYRPVVCNNLTKAEITYIFKNLDNFLRDSNNKAQNKVANDSFVCCILSHGNKGVIITSDSQALNREDIENMVGTCETLQGKPKMFFIQACRGENHGSEPVPKIVADDTTSIRSDFYLCFAAVTGDKAYRDTFKGSWFVTEVCKLFCQYATCETLNNGLQLHLNTNVAGNPEYRYQRKETGTSHTQHPTCSNQLHKSIHFFLE